MTYVRFYGGKDSEGFTQKKLTVRAVTDGDAQSATNDCSDCSDFDDDDEGPAASGTSAVATEGNDALRQYMAAYEPDPYLGCSFLPRFSWLFRWISLYAVVEHAPPAVKAALLPRELAKVQRLLQTRGLAYVSEERERRPGWHYRISDAAKQCIIAPLRRAEAVFFLSARARALAIYCPEPQPPPFWVHNRHITVGDSTRIGTSACGSCDAGDARGYCSISAAPLLRCRRTAVLGWQLRCWRT
ncbi:hypothetical_protein (plasmid) [Leishmania braziliensis MHOM/BR/75/M2904]|uniref:Hypothetical_protein n=1 Tax=Leishmania braziliensis MHOM/BR/75/M2904 TaxID=420245 RepID=A0A3P3Z1I1_LEIBR|nr:hypothetical_protein [Leishmania braziliensis MHOM/BR/75/M2904]